MLHKAVVQSASIATDEPSNHAGAALTAHELEILKLIAEGLTNAEIADKLFPSKRTIKTHRRNIIAKIQAKNTAALIKLSVNWGLFLSG